MFRPDAVLRRGRCWVCRVSATPGGSPVDRAGVVVKFVQGRSVAKFGKKIVTSWELRTNQEGFVRIPAIPQGKILVDMIVLRHEDQFLIDVPRALIGDLIKRLTLYRLRAKVEMADQSEAYHIIAGWGDEDQPDGLSFVDPRLPALGWRAFVQRDQAQHATSPVELYDAHRIALGVPMGGRDFIYGDAFAHEALMDCLAGIDFKKGCYVGQEVVSRVEHRGLTRLGQQLRHFVVGAHRLIRSGHVLTRRAGHEPAGERAERDERERDGRDTTPTDRCTRRDRLLASRVDLTYHRCGAGGVSVAQRFVVRLVDVAGGALTIDFDAELRLGFFIIGLPAADGNGPAAFQTNVAISSMTQSGTSQIFVNPVQFIGALY